MPIEIKELVIRAVVSEPQPQPTDGGAAAVDTRAVVDECVRQVLRVLKQQQER